VLPALPHRPGLRLGTSPIAMTEREIIEKQATTEKIMATKMGMEKMATKLRTEKMTMKMRTETTTTKMETEMMVPAMKMRTAKTTTMEKVVVRKKAGKGVGTVKAKERTRKGANMMLPDQ
jgi:hypothetical protein